MTTWITPNPEVYPVFTNTAQHLRYPTWWMRRRLDLERVPQRVELAIVCLGYYELYVNGRRVGDEPLAPSLSKLDRRAFRLTHDITEFLVAGINSIGIWCSSGWYLPLQFRVHEGRTPLLFVQVQDGKGSMLCGGDDQWFCRTANRSIIGNDERGVWNWDYFGGEEVLADAAVADWYDVTGDPGGWHQAAAVSVPPVTVCDRTCPPNRIGTTYTARSVRKLGDDRFEVDFGTCLAGWVDIGFRGLNSGQTVTMRFYDLPADHDRNRDHSYNQVSRYRACGQPGERFQNKFNYAGFRYMTLEGLDTCPELKEMRALLVEADMAAAGHFRCSNELFNRIHDLNVHTLRCLDLGGYTVDCPHRERLGYGADGQAVLPAYLYTMDAAAFLHKWLVDWCDVYEADTGRIQHTAPNRHHQDSPAWGGIVGPLAWSLWVHYRDYEAPKLAFPVLRGYLGYLQEAVRDGVLRADGRDWLFLGDWVAPERGMDSQDGNGGTREPDVAMRELVNTAYLIHLWQLYAKIGAVLEKTDTVQEAAVQIDILQHGLHRTFYDPKNGYYLLPEQTYQVMPLAVGAVPAEIKAQVHDRLIKMILDDKQGHLDTGMTGTTFLIDYLTRTGRHDVLATIYGQETYPGWGYMLTSGATAIWEQWNGYWSQIHSTFSGAASWFYTGLAGILPDDAHPGFDHFHLKPAFLTDLDFVECWHDCRHGRIESSWSREGGKLRWRVTIPEGSRATLHLPRETVIKQAGVYELEWDDR
jgi:alpha-L-rhamnosidase